MPGLSCHQNAMTINQDLVDQCRDFARNYVTPHAPGWEAARCQPREAMAEAANRGLLAFETPTDFGGGGENLATKLALCETLAGADMAFTFAMINTQNIPAKLSLDLGADQRRDLIRQLMNGEIFGATALSEPGAGSDFAAIEMQATRDGDGWRLNGTKGWITNVEIADIFIVYAQTEPAAGAKGVGAFLVDARHEGFHRGACYDLAGGHSIGAGEFTLSNYPVPASDVLSPPGEGFKHALGTVNAARVYVAAMCCGMIADALNTALEYGESREAFGVPILEHQGLRWSLADVATQLAALRAVTREAGQLIDDGGDAILAAAIAKKLAGDVTTPMIAACMQALGANGLRREHNLGRHLAAARIVSLADGSTEMMNERIAVSIRRDGV